MKKVFKVAGELCCNFYTYVRGEIADFFYLFDKKYRQEHFSSQIVEVEPMKALSVVEPIDLNLRCHNIRTELAKVRDLDPSFGTGSKNELLDFMYDRLACTVDPSEAILFVTEEFSAQFFLDKDSANHSKLEEICRVIRLNRIPSPFIISD